MRLIDADALWEKTFVCDEVAEVRKFIEDAPTIDAGPVVHGRWINRTKNIRGLYDYRYDCSVCQRQIRYSYLGSFNRMQCFKRWRRTKMIMQM